MSNAFTGSKLLVVTGLLSALVALGVQALASATRDITIQGAWQVESYILENGTELDVTGLIFFSESDWTVLFFVVDDEGEPRRGSGEGGDYRIEGDQLEFTHFYHLSTGEAFGGLPAAPLRMNVASKEDAAAEPCRVEVGETEMTIFFPSGNQMTFIRRS